MALGVGDLMAAADVTYTVGREAQSQYNEDLAGVRRGDTSPRKHYTQGNKDHFTYAVDPHGTGVHGAQPKCCDCRITRDQCEPSGTGSRLRQIT